MNKSRKMKTSKRKSYRRPSGQRGGFWPFTTDASTSSSSWFGTSSQASDSTPPSSWNPFSTTKPASPPLSMFSSTTAGRKSRKSRK